MRGRVVAAWREDRLAEFVGPELPVSPTEPIVRIRVMVFVAFTVLIALFDSTPEWGLVLPVLGTAMVVQPLAAKLFRTRSGWLNFNVVVDVVVSLIFAGIDDGFALLVVMSLIGLGTMEVASSPIRRAVGVGATLTVGIAAASVIGNIEHVERPALVAAVLFAFAAVVGYRFRDLVRRSRRDMHSAIHAAGGLTHMTDMRTLRFELGGDVEPILGFSNEEWVKIPPSKMVHPDDLAGMRVDVDSVVDGQILDRSGRFRHADGGWVWIRDVSRVVMHEGRPFMHGLLIDVTSERAGLAEVTDQASTDSLTGLANRRALMESLDVHRSDENAALVIIDLDRFKEVNDTMGHDAGDQVLVEVADRLRSCSRPGDLLCRLGGDEFAIVMRDISDVAAAAAAVDRFAFEVARPIEINGVRVTTSFSAGIAPGVTGPNRALTMLRHADVAMYAAKRDRVTSAVFDAQFEDELQLRVALTEGIDDALDDGSLSLHFQPIVDTATGAIVGAEGLARWEHPLFGLLFPGSFLDVVLLSERSGEFSRAMVRHALDMWQRTVDVGTPLPISVNLPVPVFEDPAFADWYAAERIRRDCDDAHLVFEINEGNLHHSGAMTEAIDRFASLGASISIDDFGTGHATFERLRWWNVAQLKVDREMVVGASVHRRDLQILESVAELALSLEYEVVAEGVETTEQFELLRGFGVTRVQGWLFSKAVVPDEFLACVQAGGFVEHPAVSRAEITV